MDAIHLHECYREDQLQFRLARFVVSSLIQKCSSRKTPKIEIAVMSVCMLP
jgi:hypothetical protein